METTIQLVLVASIFSLTIIFIVVGIWVVLILREIKLVVKKIGQVGDDIEETTRFLKQRVKDGFSFLNLLTTIMSLFGKEDKASKLIADLKEVENTEVVKEIKKEKRSKVKNNNRTSKEKKRFFFKKK